MSLVSSRLSLTHLCTIERDQNAGTSTDGWSAVPDWQPHLTDQPCRMWATAGRETVTDQTTVVVVQDNRLVLPLGTDVTEHDRVTDVTYRGTTILAGPLQIRAVLHNTDHLELLLVQVQ